MAILVLPALALVATFWLFFRRIAGSVWTRTEGKPAARGAFAVVVASVAALLGWIWWPNGDYKAIQPGERGTVQGALRQFSAVPTGHPAAPKPVSDKTATTPKQQSQQQQTRTQTTNPTFTNQTTTDLTTTTNPTTTETTPATTTTATDTTTTVAATP
jgi:hypothetical protein